MPPTGGVRCIFPECSADICRSKSRVGTPHQKDAWTRFLKLHNIAERWPCVLLARPGSGTSRSFQIGSTPRPTLLWGMPGDPKLSGSWLHLGYSFPRSLQYALLRECAREFRNRLPTLNVISDALLRTRVNQNTRKNSN